jgi:O-antigen ligase
MSAPKSGGSGAVIGIVSAMAIIVSLLCGSTILINSGKVLAFEVLGAVLITVLVANLRTQGLVQRFKENVLSGPNPLVLALLVYTAFSFLLGPTSKWYTMNEMVRVAICAAVYFGVLYNLRERLTMMMDVIMATAAAVAVFGLVSVGDSGFDRMDGISGSFGTHEALGSFLMLMLPITAAIGIFNKVDQKRRVAALAVSLLVVVCLAFTQSRSGWISELVAMGALALMAAKFYPRAKVGAKQRFAAAVPFLAFIGIAGLLLAISGAGSDVLHRASTFGSGSTDISWKERLMLWHAAITMIAAKPLFGWGLGSFPYIAAKLTPVAASATTVANFGANLRNIAHNYYLQTAAETGLVGLGLYLGMVVTFFTVGVRALGKLQDGTRKMVLIGVLAAMAGQVVDAATSPSYNIASVSMFQWLLMGVGMFAAGVPKQKEEAAVAALAFQQPSRYLTVRRGMARVLAVCACMTVMTFTVGSSDSAIADSYTTTVTHNEGVSNTGAILIGVGGLIVGYIIGYELGHHDHNDQPS